MLNNLHHRLTRISTVVTGTVLIIMSISAFIICKDYLDNRSELMLNAHLDGIAYRLQTEDVIRQSWLAETETANNLVIAIEDNGHPLLFEGTYQTLTSRKQLITLAKATAKTDHYSSTSPTLLSLHDISKVTFELRPSPKEHFLVSTALIPASRGAYLLIILKDLKKEDLQLLQLTLLFITLTSLGTLLLALFSTIFVRHTLFPIAISQQKQADFIAAASHELRSPLAVLQTLMPALHTSSPTTQEHFLELMSHECSRMSHLVNDLLLLATADAHSWSIDLESVELDTFLLDFYDTVVFSATQKDHTLLLELPDMPIHSILLDPHRIQQALMILIDNALCYTPPQTHITLTLHQNHTYTLIQVIDHGPGIPHTQKQQVFDRFYRLDTARHDKNHHGLGLSIASEILTLHQGCLSLTDTPGGGCTFTLQFPHKKSSLLF